MASCDVCFWLCVSMRTQVYICAIDVCVLLLRPGPGSRWAIWGRRMGGFRIGLACFKGYDV